MNNVRYFDAPASQTAFKVTLDCCYERIVYGGAIIGIAAKNDNVADEINSYHLWCHTCDPQKTLIPITEDEYVEKLNYVSLTLRTTQKYPA